MSEVLSFPAMTGEVLGITTYRGLGKLSDIARMSQADVFDQQTNPQGTQRDLNVSHARQAHAYVLENKLAFWPEVVLCCRLAEVLEFEPTDAQMAAGALLVYLDLV